MNTAGVAINEGLLENVLPNPNVSFPSRELCPVASATGRIKGLDKN
jgi:hypothetical protein